MSTDSEDPLLAPSHYPATLSMDSQQPDTGYYLPASLLKFFVDDPTIQSGRLEQDWRQMTIHLVLTR